MSRWRHSPSIFLSSPPLLLVLLLLLPLASSQGSTRWQTLSGNSPLVVARGGVSGIFPDSSVDAYQLAQLTSLPDLVLWCDVQLTKDGVGICAPSLMLDNCTDVDRSIKNKKNQYIVNGVLTEGYFSLDFTFNDLAKVVLAQGVFSRTSKFNSRSPILTVEDVAGLKPQGLWLNIQHDVFYTQHKLSMRSYVLSVSRRVVINYISSPEEGFLRSIASRFNPKITKFIFRIMGPDDVDPSTNKTYSSSLKDLATIKKFASGILVPKSYIWPVGADMYLQPHTSLVSDAHKAGLEVFASEFYNDIPPSYNYSYDPVSEYLYFIDNGDFTVDGVLSDFPITPSNAIDCFSHLGSNASDQVTLTVISKNGASGDYPGCTDLAYQKAIADGVDVLDCSVQMSKDGVPFCLRSINLIDSTTVAQSSFSNLAQTIPELSGNGIYTFTMTWDDIKTLTPAISNPYAGGYKLFRNPKFKNAGKLLALSDFLALAKNASSLTGVMINIENAAYLIEKQKLAVVDAVLDALSKAGYDNQKNLKVMIQSTNSSVLMKLKDKKNYELVYKVDENIGDALDSTIEDIKQFADSVVVSKSSVFPVNALFISGSTDVVSKLQSYKLPVYVETFSNEFVSQAWDFFSDPTVEINSYVTGAGVNGVVTDFPMTSARYKRNWCLNLGDKTPPYMAPVQPGSLMQLIAAELLPPAEAPNPVLTAQDVVESPLPSVINSPFSKPGDETAPSRSPNGQPKIAICLSLPSLAALFYIILLL